MKTPKEWADKFCDGDFNTSNYAKLHNFVKAIQKDARMNKSMKSLTATYVWSAIVTVQVPDDASDDKQRETLDDAAKTAYFSLKDSVLHECEDNPNLVD